MYLSLALIGDNSGYSKSDVQTLNMYSTVNIIVEKISNLLKIILREFDMSNVLATTVIRVRKINITIVIIVSFINSLANSNDTSIKKTITHFTTSNSYNTIIKRNL